VVFALHLVLIFNGRYNGQKAKIAVRIKMAAMAIKTTISQVAVTVLKATSKIKITAIAARATLSKIPILHFIFRKFSLKVFLNN